MSNDESLLASPPTHDVAVHVRDYGRFTTLFKWGAVGAFIVGMGVLMILSS